VALLVIGLLAIGGAFAGVALRPEEQTTIALPPSTPPAAREAVRNATSLSDAFITIADAVTSSVVRIEVERTVSLESSPLPSSLSDLYDRPRSSEMVPQVMGGSGFLVSADGYILTNNHVIADADRITVTLRDKRVLDAEVVGTDPATDIAVIRVEGAGLPAVALGNSDEARVGEWVLAIGNPGFADESPLDF